MANNRISNNEIMATLQTISATLESLNNRVSALEKKPTASTPKKSPKAKATADDWAKYTPKKDADGNWNWRSYKCARQRYLNDHGFNYEAKGWMSREDFAKACKPWTDKFGAYIKKDAR